VSVSGIIRITVNTLLSNITDAFTVNIWIDLKGSEHYVRYCTYCVNRLYLSDVDFPVCLIDDSVHLFMISLVLSWLSYSVFAGLLD